MRAIESSMLYRMTNGPILSSPVNIKSEYIERIKCKINPFFVIYISYAIIILIYIHILSFI